MGKNDLRDRILKASTVKETALISESELFKKDMIPTPVPMINVALAGTVDGGLTPGMTMIAGPSKHFKTKFGLLISSAYIAKYPDAVVLFYDSEFGSPESYFAAENIPTENVIHTPITNIEYLKQDIMAQLKHIERNDRVLIFIDSVGNLASNKEIQDALDQKIVADMSRAKALKSLFRMVTPHLSLKNIPLIAINHTYKTQEMYAKDVVSGGTGGIYNADNIWIIGRQQEKEKDENDPSKKVVSGWNFTINIEKSRYVKERSKINVSVSYEKGINKYSGIVDLAIEAGYINKEGKGKYSLGDTGEIFTFDELETNEEVMQSLLADEEFKKYIENKYKLPEA